MEDELFRVPKKDFTKHSEVFADMFVMPSGDHKNSEGGNDEHPIFLEGYKKNDFIALLKVMYPRYDGWWMILRFGLIPCSSEMLLSGTNTVMKIELSKEEWIGVLNLSTRWDMRKVRKGTGRHLTWCQLIYVGSSLCCPSTFNRVPDRSH